ncbi:hypothetical protein L202_02708 [Cryptococcus amylolentus CBS 6039]|uniref:Uncharacterized protein n=2 Tax=Cryptococcus amylolentus TaxID=104669 RepID=A0A1E3HVX1_9TREE|nr:hypothetical protein L202_02708 [Cryptococcus amylolentus CBS 6039]ODN80468.1 hypothetical protein L202_02708 [Cryptococcus amylolentus CBS 6039]ODO09086.1 hypothetical protein I350_02685 [Cryptococcus amylolentus CBS 6273]
MSEQTQSQAGQTVVDKLQETWETVSRTERLMFMMNDAVLPSMPRDTPEEAEEFDLESIKQAFHNETGKRILERIKYTAEEDVTIDSLGASRTPLQIDISSVFAEGQQDPQEWLNNLAATIGKSGQQSIVQSASLALGDSFSPDHVMRRIATYLNDSLLEEAEGDALKRFQESCREMSKEDLEDKLDRASGLWRPNRKLSIWESLAPWHENNQSIGKLSGNVLCESAVELGPFNLESLDDVNATLRSEMDQREQDYQKRFGENAPEDLNDSQSLPAELREMNEKVITSPHFKQYLEFEPSSQITEGLTRIYESADGSQPPEQQDILPALRIEPRQSTFKKPGFLPMMRSARLSFFEGVDEVTAVMSDNPDNQFFRRTGMVPDKRSVDWNNFRFRLVEENSLDAPCKLEELWPIHVEDLTSAGDGEDDGTADEEKSRRFADEEELSTLTN